MVYLQYKLIFAPHEGLIGDATLGRLKFDHNITVLSKVFKSFEVVVSIRKQQFLAESLDLYGRDKY